MTTKSQSEKQIQRAILAWLKSTSLLHWRQNAGMAFFGGKGAKGRRQVRLGPNGAPDIVVVVPPSGRFVGLEVKSAKGRLRPDQKEFAQRLAATGASYYVVRSKEEAIECLKTECTLDLIQLPGAKRQSSPKTGLRLFGYLPSKSQVSSPPEEDSALTVSLMTVDGESSQKRKLVMGLRGSSLQAATKSKQ